MASWTSSFHFETENKFRVKFITLFYKQISAFDAFTVRFYSIQDEIKQIRQMKNELTNRISDLEIQLTNSQAEPRKIIT